MTTTAPELRTTAEEQQEAGLLSHYELCRLLRVFREGTTPTNDQDGRIARWVERQIESVSARLRAGSGITEEQVERGLSVLCEYWGSRTNARGDILSEGERAYRREALCAALEAASPLAPRQAPEGWVLVREFPTEAMLKAARSVKVNQPPHDLLYSDFGLIWSAMLAASPTAPGDAGGAWRPIETAPKDGTRVLTVTLLHSGPEWNLGHYDEETGEWFSEEGADIGPTHWSPLPHPPASEGR